MKKYIMLIMLLTGFNAKAGVIEIKLDQTSTTIGSSVEVSLLASNFDAFDLFNFDFIFDSPIFSYDPLSLQSDLPLDDGFLTLGLIGTSLLNHLALSFFDFDSFAGGDFLLAKFKLTAIGNGVSNFSLENVEFYEPFAIDQMVNIDSSSIESATVIGVPEPTTWLLLIPALFMLKRRQIGKR